MEKMRENISYIISEDDSDKIKMEKILKKFTEQKMKLFSKDITINSTDNNIVVSTLNFILQIGEEKEEIKYPYISSTENFNKNIFENILAAKKAILFDRLGIQPKLQETNTTQVSGTITRKQKELSIDKSRNDTKKII